MYKFNPILIAVFASSIFASCVTPGEVNDPYVAPIERQRDNFFYVPTPPNTRFNKEKNDLSFNVDHSSGGRYNGVNAQAGFLPTKHIGIIAGYSGARHKGSITESMKFHQFEIGAGHITKLRNGWHFENYFGWGGGEVVNYMYSGVSRFKLNRYFIQPALAYTTANNSFSLGIVSRFSGVRFSPSELFFLDEREPFTADQINLLKENPFQVFWEPGFKISAGWKNFRFNAGYTFSTDLSSSELDFPNSNLAVGAIIQFSTAKKH